MKIPAIIHRLKTKPKGQRQHGFTLIELLLVLGLLSIMLIVLTDMFTSVLNVQNESQENSSVDQDGRYLLARLAYDVRRASALTIPEDLQVAMPSLGSTSATITWSTVVASNSQIQYGTTTSYGSNTTLDPSLVTSHSVNITGLTNATTYHFRTLSTDGSGNLTTSPDYTFVTGTGGGSTSTPAFIQSMRFANNVQSGKTLQAAFTSNVTAGNLIVAAASYEGGFQPDSCTDTLGNSYSVATYTFSSFFQDLVVCYAISNATGANTVSVNLPSDVFFRHLLISEYSGITSSNPVDVYATNVTTTSGTPAVSTSGSATTTGTNDLIYGLVMVDDSAGVTTITADPGFTQRDSVNGKDMAIQDRVLASPGAIASTQTFGAQRHYMAHMVAFKAATTSSTLPSKLGGTAQTMRLTVGGATYNYAVSGGNLQLNNGTDTGNLNSSQSTVSNLSFQRLGNVGGNNMVQISFTLTSRVTAGSAPRSQTFTTTVEAKQ